MTETTLTKRVLLSISPAQYEQVRELAHKGRITIPEIIRVAVKQYLAGQPEGGEK